MASDFLLEIDGIKGESQDSKHKDAIEIETFNWGVKNAGSFASGGGGGAGKGTFQDVNFTTKVNKSSPNLMIACATGQHIKNAKLIVRKHGDGQQEYYVLTMEDVLVSSYHCGDIAGGDTIPEDQFALNFAKIKFEYKPQKSDGSLDSAITGAYDLKANKKV